MAPKTKRRKTYQTPDESIHRTKRKAKAKPARKATKIRGNVGTPDESVHKAQATNARTSAQSKRTATKKAASKKKGVGGRLREMVSPSGVKKAVKFYTGRKNWDK